MSNAIARPSEPRSVGVNVKRATSATSSIPVEPAVTATSGLATVAPSLTTSNRSRVESCAIARDAPKETRGTTTSSWLSFMGLSLYWAAEQRPNYADVFLPNHLVLLQERLAITRRKTKRDRPILVQRAEHVAVAANVVSIPSERTRTWPHSGHRPSSALRAMNADAATTTTRLI